MSDEQALLIYFTEVFKAILREAMEGKTQSSCRRAKDRFAAIERQASAALDRMPQMKEAIRLLHVQLQNALDSGY